VGRQPAGRSGTDELKARAVAWVERTCMDQNVPAKLSDQVALDRVAELLAQGSQTGVSRDSSKRL
jgi:hypothetical protein